MKRIALCIFSVLALSTAALTQERGGRAAAPPPALEPGASQADVDKAVLAAPARLKDQATVIKWGADHQMYTTLRKGTNNLVCYDRSGFPLQQPFSVECTSMANLDRVKQNLKVEMTAGDRAKAEATFADLEKSGMRVKPEFGSVFYHVQGADQARAGSHMTVAVPGATEKSLGLPESGRGGGVWIMNAGTTTAHLMIPGE